ncbi:MAG: hypothetical protein DSY46_05415 [Hydrogenimonas sp.]|nr:MAG: hypothetical protein DSY46_05415 [Hydrogenimonas sp.]
MESKTNYIIVGLFVLLLGTSAILFALWMGNYDNKQSFSYYYTYMEESVAGLPPDGSVKYMGVDIGKVKEIYIDPADPTRIRLLLQLPKSFPIREGMYAMLKFTGITGLAYIEIIGGKRDAPILTTQADTIAVIPSKPSMLAQLGTSATDIAEQIAQALNKLNRTFSEENMYYINHTLANIDHASKSLNEILKEENVKKIDQILTNLAKASDQIDRLYQTIDLISTTTRELGRESNQTLLAIKESAQSFQQLNQTLQQHLDAGDFNIRSILQQTLSQSSALMYDLQSLITQLQEDAEALKNSPRDLFFKEANPNLGPGEKERE